MLVFSMTKGVMLTKLRPSYHRLYQEEALIARKFIALHFFYASPAKNVSAGRHPPLLLSE